MLALIGLALALAGTITERSWLVLLGSTLFGFGLARRGRFRQLGGGGGGARARPDADMTIAPGGGFSSPRGYGTPFREEGPGGGCN